jgi:hypothetical protein
MAPLRCSAPPWRSLARPVTKSAHSTGDSCDGKIAVDELLTIVTSALANADASAGGDGQITADEILTAVNNALSECSIARAS